MTNGTDPLGTGLVANLARPWGNVTGVTNISGELEGKALELLKEIVPKLNRVGDRAETQSCGHTEDSGRSSG